MFWMMMMYHIKTKWTHTTHIKLMMTGVMVKHVLKNAIVSLKFILLHTVFFYNYFLLVLVSSISPAFLSCNYMYYILLYHCFLFFLGLRYWSSNAPEKGIWQHGCSIYCRKTARSSGMEIQFQKLLSDLKM